MHFPSSAPVANSPLRQVFTTCYKERYFHHCSHMKRIKSRQTKSVGRIKLALIREPERWLSEWLAVVYFESRTARKVNNRLWNLSLRFSRQISTQFKSLHPREKCQRLDIRNSWFISVMGGPHETWHSRVVLGLEILRIPQKTCLSQSTRSDLLRFFSLWLNLVRPLEFLADTSPRVAFRHPSSVHTMSTGWPDTARTGKGCWNPREIGILLT